MKFVTFVSGAETHLGVMEALQIVDLTAASQLVITAPPKFISFAVREGVQRIGAPAFFSMINYLRAWDQEGVALIAVTQELVASVLEGVDRNAGPLVYLENSVRMLSPLPMPNALRDGYAFRQHVETMRRNRGMEMVPEFDQFPVFYYGNHHTVFGPGKFSVQKRHLDRLDYELEIAIVIGKRGKNIKAERADEHIFGLLIMNDMSCRSWQQEEMKLSLGPAKGKDFGTVLGPCLVTFDELGDRITKTAAGNRYNLEMKASVNGKLLSRGNASSMNWTFAQIIEVASYGVFLDPGDVIGSGTVGTGCLAELNSSKITDNLWLKAGDKVTLEVERLGKLETEVVEEDESYR